MVFLAGPRQVGKTWLAKELAGSYSTSLYLNYDSLEHREMIQRQDCLPHHELIIFDELHKMPDWKNYLKGVYDTKPVGMRLLVTGSARLETFSHVGDALAGRYFLHRLLPLSLAELSKLQEPLNLAYLLERSGFPEPYLAENNIEADRWRRQYIESLLNTDLFEYDTIQNMKAIRLLFELLRRRVGSPISYQSLTQDLGISAVTVKKYIDILEALYIVFRVPPFSNNIARSILKEPKIYFFDTGLVVGDSGAQLENFMAVSLLKHIYGRQDYLGEDCGLYYLRTKDGQEVDFAIVKNHEVENMIEVKTSDHDINPVLLYFKEKYGLAATQVVQHLKQARMKSGVTLAKAEDFLRELYL